jgi:hypothetical protein
MSEDGENTEAPEKAKGTSEETMDNAVATAMEVD